MLKSPKCRRRQKKKTWTDYFVYALPRYWGKPLLSSTSKSPRRTTRASTFTLDSLLQIPQLSVGKNRKLTLLIYMSFSLLLIHRQLVVLPLLLILKTLPDTSQSLQTLRVVTLLSHRSGFCRGRHSHEQRASGRQLLSRQPHVPAIPSDPHRFHSE